MTPRSIRRAAERKAAKQARRGQQNTPAVFTVASVPAAAPVSPAKIAANQANARLSTGPTSTTGKLISSKNALKTGLTGRTVLLSTDNIDAYEALLQKFVAHYEPATLEERDLVQSIVDTTWRLERIVTIEFGIYGVGSLEFADQFEDLEPALRAQMIQVETYLKYEKSLRNLNTQEARLHRHLVKDTAELKRLQTERIQRESEIQATSAATFNPAPEPPNSQEVGFVFSNDEIPSEYALAFAQKTAADSAVPEVRS